MTRAGICGAPEKRLRRLTAAEAELTEIDSKFGDADHGLTMAKIAGGYLRSSGRRRGGDPVHAG